MMSFDDLIEIVNDRINPFSLNDEGKKNIANLYNKFPTELILESIDIGIKQYIT